MALSQGGTHYTKLIHLENGRSMVRRINRLEVQGKDGRLYVLEGKDLPDFIQTCCGEGQKGKHLGQILLNGKDLPSIRRPGPRWPDPRDVGHIVLGMTFLGILLRIAAVLAGSN